MSYSRGVILPEKEDMLPFINYTVPDFKRWLRGGIKLYIKKNSVWGFEPIAVFIGQDDFLFLDLRNIYGVLPSKKSQRFFRKAVVELLSLKKVGQPMIKELFLLSRAIGLKLQSRQLQKVPPDLIDRFGK